MKTRSGWLTLPLYSFLSSRRRRAAYAVGHEPGQLKGRWGDSKCQEGSNNHEKLIFQSRGGWTVSTSKQGAFTFSRAPLTSSSRRSPSRLEVWAAPASSHSSPSLAPLSPRSCFCRAFRVAWKQPSQKAVPPSENLRSSLLDQPVHPTRVTTSLKYLVC